MTASSHQISLLLAIVLLTLPLSGCFSDGTNGTDGEVGPEGPEGSQGVPGINGENGVDGVNGTNGINGANGINGTDGIDGAPGTNGLNALVSTIEEPAGANCEFGGLRFDIGVDDSSDGILHPGEIDQTTYICNGQDGTDGADGADGTGGTGGSSENQIMLTSIYTLGHSSGCSAGGQIIMQGQDNGDGEGAASNGILELGEVDYTIRYCSTQMFDRLTDVNPEENNSYPGNWQMPGRSGGIHLVVDNVLYFNAYTNDLGNELWAYDLSTNQAWLVADINNGSNGSFPGLTMSLVLNHTIYFSAYTSGVGNELWAYDTKTQNTSRIGASFFNPGEDMATVFGDNIYFTAFTMQYATELWAYNADNQTFWIIEDIHMGSSSNPGWYMNFIYNNKLYFTARDLGNVHDIWTHDPSNGSTWKVATVNNTMYPDAHPGKDMHVIIGDTLYFDGDDGNNGRELWAYNFVNDTTWMAAEIMGGGQDSNPGKNMFAAIDDTLYFDASDNALWAYNTVNGTTWIIEQFPSPPGEESNEIVSGGILYFSANDGINGHELWFHNPASGLTWMVADAWAGSNGSMPAANFIIDIDGILYFDADSEHAGREFWAHDPLDNSTWQVVDINRDLDGNPGRWMVFLHEGVLYFDANDGDHGVEMWSLWFKHTISYS